MVRCAYSMKGATSTYIVRFQDLRNFHVAKMTRTYLQGGSEIHPPRRHFEGFSAVTTTLSTAQNQSLPAM